MQLILFLWNLKTLIPYEKRKIVLKMEREREGGHDCV